MNKRKTNLPLYFVCMLSFSFYTPRAFGQGTDISAAKREGEVVIYGTLDTPTTKNITEAFEKKYGIRSKYFRGSSTAVMDRAQTEYRAGKVTYDVVFMPTSPMDIFKKAGLFAKYESPANADFPEELRDKDGVLSPTYRSVIVGYLYNTKYIKPADAPKSYEDLLDPKWKGKIVMGDPTRHTTSTAWLASLYKVIGKENAEKFIRALADQRPVLVESMLPSSQNVGSGEQPLGVGFIKYVYIFGKEGAPLDYVRLGRFLGDGHNIALSSKAPHPNAGKLFIDFFLSDAGMKIMAEAGEFVNRKGVYPPLKDADKVKFVEMDDLGNEGFKQKKAEYHRIFFK